LWNFRSRGRAIRQGNVVDFRRALVVNYPWSA
jgi:hypothetical protein